MVATLSDGIACLAAAASLGYMGSFSAVVAPNVFKTLPPQSAGVFLRALFPKYFAHNGLAALLCAVLTTNPVAAALFAVSGTAMLLVLFMLIPRINAARDAMVSGAKSDKATFQRLHGLSVAINLAEIVAMGLAIFLIAQR